MILDTSFLIDLQREWVRAEAGAATRFLRIHDRDEFAISVAAVIEFLEGYEILRDGERFLEPFEWIDVTPRIARTASRVRRTLRQSGNPIGDFDILIAATTIEFQGNLVTADVGHFEIIENLMLAPYR